MIKKLTQKVLYLSDDEEGKDYQGEAFYNNQAIIAVLTEDIKKLNTPGLYAGMKWIFTSNDENLDLLERITLNCTCYWTQQKNRYVTF